MPRVLPGAIQAKVGQSNFRVDWLVEWRLNSGTRYFSKHGTVNYAGNVYTPRIISIDGLTAPFIDRKSRDFGKVTITLDNLADDGSSNFFFTAIDAQEIFEDKILKIHLYDVDAGVAVDSLWSGYSGRPEFDPEGKTVRLGATFLWDSLEIPFPKIRVQHRCPYAFINETHNGQQSIGCPYTTHGTPGFATCDKRFLSCQPRGMTRFFGGWTRVGLDETKRDRENIRKQAVPIVYGAGEFRVRPLIYLVRVDGGQLLVNFVVSGTHQNLPFAAEDLVSNSMKLWDTGAPVTLDFKPGAYPQAVDQNFTRFPDEAGHSLVAHGCAIYRITDQVKDRLGSLANDEIKVLLVNGRKLLSTGLPSQNPALICQDILADPVYGIGVPLADFDASAVSDAAVYAGTRYQLRVEMHEQQPLIEVVQGLLSDFHGFITFNNGKVQINAKKNSAAAFATFGTGGRLITNNNEVKLSEKDFGEIINQVDIKYRNVGRHLREIVMYDKPAQVRAGQGIEKVVEEEIESFLFDEDQVAINGAILVREEQNANLFIEFTCPLYEGLDVSPGDVIEVKSPDIFNNGSNNLFRVMTQTFSVGEFPEVTFKCQVYKSAVYQDTADPLGGDILRDTNDNTSQARPPDVTPVSLAVVDVVVSDTEGRLANLRAVWTYPVVDLAAEQADGIFREYPIAEVQLWWRYTDESVNESRIGKAVKHPTAEGVFQVDFDKTRSIECFFVAIGHNRSRAPLGYIPDPTKATALTADLTATATVASVVDSGPFAVNDFTICEREIDKVTAKAAGQLTFESQGGNRKPQHDTTAIAHPKGTEIAVAKLSYPSLTVSLAAPRFTYPVVASLNAVQRGDGVKFKWPDVAAENEEKYYLFWSIDEDAGSNPAKLGSATPTWYTTNPESPPAGVNKVITDAVRHTVLQEEIGAIGTVVYGRVAAKNGKRNFSSALSALASNTSTGRGIPPSLAPADPSAADIITNVPPADITAKKVEVALRIWADTTKTKTFNEAGAEWVGSFLVPFAEADLTKREKFPFDLAAAERDLTNVTVRQALAIGERWKWTQNFNANGAGKAFSGEVTTVSFIVGGYSLDPADLVSLQISGVAQDGKHTLITVTLQQPAAGSPVLLKNFWLERNVPNPPGDAAYHVVEHVHLANDPSYSVLGATKTIEKLVKHPSGVANITIRGTLVAIGGLQRQVSLVINATGDTTGDTAAAGAVGNLSLAWSRKKGWKSTWTRPTSNAKSLLGFWVAYFNDTSGTVWMTADTGQNAGSEAAAEVFVTDTRHVTHLKREEINATFLNGVKVKVTPVNVVNGVETRGTSTTSGALVLPNEEVAPGDTDVPGAPPAPVIKEYFGDLIVKAQRPTSQANAILDWQLAIQDSSNAPTTADPPIAGSGATFITVEQNPAGVAKFRVPKVSASRYFFTRCKNANQPTTGGPGGNGWSAWSSPASISGTKRPLDDTIGDGVPTLPTSTERANNTQSGSTTTTVKLDAGASAVDGFYVGMSIFITSMASDADKVRRIIAYVGSTKVATVETAYSTAPGTGVAFEISRGNYGFANHGQTGTVSVSPMRVYFAIDTGEDVVEFILPSGANAFSITAIRVEVVKKANGAVKFSQELSISTKPVHRFLGPGAYTPIVRCAFRNLFRDGGSDGWSAWSSWVEGYTSAAGNTYDPAATPPIETDIFDDANYPTKYPVL